MTQWLNYFGLAILVSGFVAIAFFSLSHSLKSIDARCPGCGKSLSNIKAWEKHADKCTKMAKLLQLSYNIPIVTNEDLTHLEVKISSSKKDWGIWNSSKNDWVRDKNGEIDSRLYKRNIKVLLNCVIAESIKDAAKRKPQ
jgi:hypothetical protein